MRGKKTIDFITLRPAFTQRNMTTLILVAAFVAVYSLAGGRVSLDVPRIPQSTNGQFGSIPGLGNGDEGRRLAGVTPEDDAAAEQAAAAKAAAESEKAAQVLGMKPTSDEQAREDAVNARGKLFDPAVDGGNSAKPLDKNGLLSADPTENEIKEAKLRKLERHQGDSLAEIEDRLNIRRLTK